MTEAEIIVQIDDLHEQSIDLQKVEDQLNIIHEDVGTKYVRVSLEPYSKKQKEADEALYELVTEWPIALTYSAMYWHAWEVIPARGITENPMLTRCLRL